MNIKDMHVECRWSKGIEHEPHVDELIRLIADMDFYHFSDSFEFKVGGDGDNGETLAFILDELVERGLVEIKVTHKTPDTREVSE